jgi:aspartokinase/homoserine dehydrogenase 1
MTLVMKFGGTSVGSPEAIQRTAELCEKFRGQWGKIVVVTDLLTRAAHDSVAGDASSYRDVARELRHKHYQAIAELATNGEQAQVLTAEIDRFIERYVSLCKAVLVLGEVTPRALDAMTSIGEQMSVRLLAAQLTATGTKAQAVDARSLIVTDDDFQSANPSMEPTTEKCESVLKPLLEDGIVPVVTGFVAATAEGTTTTLGRGRSDYSAAILGQALQADEVWIWTDVDGVMTADPRLVPDARSIQRLSYREVAELAYYGAKVLHPLTIRPVVENNIPLRIKNTFNPDHPGTVIVENAQENHGKIKAVTAIRNLSLVNVEGKGMMGVPGIAARTFGAVARSEVSVLLISQASSEQSICFTIPADCTDEAISSLEAEFANELQLRDVDQIWAQNDVAIITVVGAGMRGTPGIAGRLFGALGNRGVNIIAIAQGSSECIISMVVEDGDTAGALSAIHRLIVTD